MDNLRISTKLIIFLLLPIITVLFFAITTVIDKQQQLQNTQNASHFSGITEKFISIIYHIQKERGLSAGVVESRGDNYKLSLMEQRLETDSSISLLNQNISSIYSYINKDTTINIQHLEYEFAQLLAIRDQVDQFDGEDAFKLYSHIVADILNIVSFIQQLSVEPEHKEHSASLLNILWLEEYSGQERGALNRVFASQKFDAEKFSSISRYIAGQNASLIAFYNIAGEYYQNKLKEVLSNKYALEVNHYREIIINRARRNDALNSLQILIGYGGFIHNFKNYVIRGDAKYAVRVRKQLDSAIQQIEVYRKLPNINDAENTALNTIKSTLYAYSKHLSVITKLGPIETSVTDIDNIVKVDDKPALDAISILHRKITLHDPDYWWNIASQRLDGIHKISSLIMFDLKHITRQRAELTQDILYIYIIITVIILLLSTIIGFKIGSSLINNLQYIAYTMNDSQVNQKFDQLLNVTGTDEISEISNAFNRLIFERKKSEADLRLAAKVFTSSHEGIVITDTDANVVDVNPSFCRITGYSRKEVLGKNQRLLNSGKQSPEFYKDMWSTLEEKGFWSNEIWNRKKNGDLYPQILSITAIVNEQGSLSNYIAVTQNLEQEKKLESLAHYDVLTKLPNRILLSDRFEQAIARSNRNKNKLALCFLDLDKFKQVNDTYGHVIGDKLLIEVSERIKSTIREVDTVSRQGGDEFVVLLGDVEELTEVEELLTRLITFVSQPYAIDGSLLKIGTSIGFTLYPTDNSDFDSLMKHADHAMYEAKSAGRNCYRLFQV